jgi:Berberine and berberine like
MVRSRHRIPVICHLGGCRPREDVTAARMGRTGGPAPADCPWFPGPTLTRLRELKAVYDPQNVFNQNFPIDPVL